MATTLDQVLLSWMFADTGPLAYHNPLRWSTKKPFNLTLADISNENRGFARPIHVKEFEADREKRAYKVSSLQELQEKHGPPVATAVATVAEVQPPMAKAAPYASAASETHPTQIGIPPHGTGPAQFPTQQPIPVVAADAVQPPQPQAIEVPTEHVPSAPASFPELQSLPESKLQYFQDNSVALDDWLLSLPAVVELHERAQKCQQESKDLAERLLSVESDLHSKTTSSSTASVACQERLVAVEGLLQSRDEIRDRSSAPRLAQTLASKAVSADQSSEARLRQALESPGPMDASALAAFRQDYIKQKRDKHMRLALKERLERA